jgi:hypothetical protein
MIVSGDQKACRACRRVVDGFADFRVYYFYNTADDMPWRAKLAEFTRLFNPKNRS